MTLGDKSHATMTFGGALPVGPQAFIGAANPHTTGHRFFDPADNRIESPGAGIGADDPAQLIFLQRMSRRR